MLAPLIIVTILNSFQAAASGAETVTLGGPFELIDQDGVTRRSEDFRGSFLLIYFGFTHCPDLCPTSLTKMAQAIDEFAARAPARATHVLPVFITVDPARDTVAVLKDYVAYFHPRLIGLTGSTLPQIGHLESAYRSHQCG